MATATTNTDQPSIIIDRAIQDLVNSFQIQIPDGQSASIRLNEVRLACNELRDGFSFHSEKGRLLVISELTKLNGNCVVKIIRKGLSRLSKLYTGDAKTFEDEAIHFVKLCCLQYSKQIGSEKGKQIASPAIIVDWTVELCDEMMKPRENISLPDTNLSKVPCLVKYLSKLTDLYTSIISERFKIVSNSAPNFTLVEPWRAFFDALKPRIHFESFEELIEETAAIVKTEGILDFMKFSSAGVPKYPILLQLWIELLNFSFVTNWFACETAKHDFLVHDVRYAPSLPFSDKRTYGESLICEICKAISFLTNHPNGQLKLPSDKVKIQVFFDHSEVLLRHTMPCLQLIQSEIETNLIKQIFLILGIKFNQNLLPGITELDTKDCEIALGVFQKMLLSPDQLFIPGLSQAMNVFEVFFLKRLNHMSTSRPHQLASFNAITQALLSLPDKQQVLRVLRIWKENFPDDNSYHMLSELFVLVTAVIQMKRDDISSDIERLISFLLQLTKECLFTLHVWRPLMVNLITSLSHSWDGPEIPDLLRNFAHKSRNLTCSQNENCLEDESVQKINHILNFVRSKFREVSKSDKLKIKALKLGLDLFEDASQPNEYEFLLDVILLIASDMEKKRIRQYILHLLQTVRAHMLTTQYPLVCKVIKLIDDSCCIEKKSEMFECFLELLQEFREEDIVSVINACCEFLQLSLPVDTATIKRFFNLAAKGRLNSCQFVSKCLRLNKTILGEDRRVNEHIIFLLNIVDKTLSSNKESCGLFFHTIHNYLQLQMLSYSSIGVFELIVASIAGSIAVGKFHTNLNEAILKVLCTLVHSCHLRSPAVILNLFIYLKQILQASLGKSEGYLKLFSEGLRLIANLPLKLPQIIRLMHNITGILRQENITDEQEVWNVMFHMFKMDKKSSSALDPNDLELHFKRLLTPSIVRNTAQITPVVRRIEHIVAEGVVLDQLFSLSDLLVDRMPKTFANKTSADLFKFMVKRTKQNFKMSSVILPVAEAVIKENVLEDELRSEIEEIEQILLCVQPGVLIHFVAECMREYYLNGLKEKKRTKIFILQILESFEQWKLNVDDICKMIGSFLNIPKQLVLVFKEASSDKEAVKGMARIFHAVSEVDPLILTGDFLLQIEKELHLRLTELIQHDFNMLLAHTPLKVFDACSILAFYGYLNTESLPNFLDVLALSVNGDMRNPNSNTYWTSKYHRFEVLTPGNLAYLVLVQLKRLEIPNSDLRNETLRICCHLFSNHNLNQQVHSEFPWNSTLGEYIEFFLSVISHSSYYAEIEYWLTFLDHYAVQCKSVILAACSWKAGCKSCEDAQRMNEQVSKTLLKLLICPGTSIPSCYASFMRELDVIARVIKSTKEEEIIYKLFELIFTSIRITEACLDVLPSWSKEQSLLFIDKMQELYEKRKREANLEQIDSEIEIPLQILPFAAKAFPNSATKVFDIFTIIEKGVGHEDPLSLGLIPVWHKQMTEAGYPSQVIQSWCTSLVHSQNLCSSDVDAVINLTPETIKLLSKETDEIGKCLFSMDAPRTWKSEHDTDAEHRANLESFKRCLLLARLLNELACIAGQLKENVNVLQKTQDCTKALCSAFLDEKSGNLYKVRYNLLKELSVLLFGKDNENQEESMAQIMTQEPLSKSLVILFRRLARSVVLRPTIFGLVRGIVHAILNHSVRNPSRKYREIQSVIHKTTLNFESNQDAIHTLQASGYNQSTVAEDDLWYSSSIQMSAYVKRIMSDESSRMELSLRQLWTEWKTILSENKVAEIEVNGKNVKTAELFKSSDSLETMESQLTSVKQATKCLPYDDWSSFRRRQLLRIERRLRKSIDEQKQQVKSMNGSDLTKMVIVWENRLLEAVKTCSEKIPGCYAPNGFHSEKPVICGIAIDNRIPTLYKEDNSGCRAELENVEVKLFPAGMFVFGRYSSIHPYDTEQLWAAFYKMLLDKRLVPKIFLSNVSPAFDWIKQFVITETSPPPNANFCSCCNLIPSSENFFDYEPEGVIQRLSTKLADSHMKELIILTPDNAKLLVITNIEPPNRNKLIREHMDEVVFVLNSRLKEKHPKSHDKILNRLKFAIRKTVELCIDGYEPTEEFVSSSINMEKLLFGCEDAQQNSNVAPYSTIILDAVKTVTGKGSKKPYDGCEHVVFLQPYE